MYFITIFLVNTVCQLGLLWQLSCIDITKNWCPSLLLRNTTNKKKYDCSYMEPDPNSALVMFPDSRHEF